MQAESGLSLMRAAVDHDVPGIDADCGGMCACATCHVFVEPAWGAKLAPPSAQEEEMLNFHRPSAARRPGSPARSRSPTRSTA